MARKKARNSHWLNNHWWLLSLGEWISLTLFFEVLILLFCLFFIRRHILPYHFNHTFS